MAKGIDDWRNDVLAFLSPAIKIDDAKQQISLRKASISIVHEIGYFFDHQLKDFPNSLTVAEQLKITAAVVTHIHDRLAA